MRLLALLAFGAAVGLAAAAAEWGLVPVGSIPGDQLPLLLGFFAAAGAALALAGDAVGGMLARRERGLTAAGVVAPLVGLALFVPINLRGSPDVYLLVSDTTRADHLSLYGYDRTTTPFLEELALRAVVFTNAVSQGSHTLVSTPSILTSRYPTEHGMSRYSEVLPESIPLLSEHLKSAGYRTYAYATNPHLAPDRGFARGFDAYAYNGRWQHAGARVVNSAFLAWLDAERADGPHEPVFAFLFYLDPHSPYAPPEKFQRLFDDTWQGEPLARWPRDEGQPPADSGRLRNLVAQYDGSIAYWDQELRSFVSALERRGAFDNAMLIYTSDHGEEFFEHGHWGHDRTLFEESIRVPLLVSLPSPIRFPRLARRSGVIDDVASSVDIVPTILEAVGAEPDPGARGRSLLSRVLGREPEGPERFAYNEEILHSYGPYDVRAIRTRTHKYIRILEHAEESTPRDLFFDLRAEPSERTNLLPSDDPSAERHRQMLERMIGEMSRVASPENETVPLHPQRLEQLKVLGYVGEEG